MAGEDTITQLQTAFPPPQVPAAIGSGSSSGTEVPLGSAKGNFYGKERAPLEEVGKGLQDIKEATKEQGENAISRAVGNLESAENTEKEAGTQVTDLGTLTAMHEAEMKKQLERAQPVIDAADKFQFHQYWSDAPTANKVLAAISSALLGFGTGQYHNIAMDIAEKDHARQVTELNALMERAKMAGASVDRLREIHRDALQNMALMQAAKLKAMAAQAERMAAGSAIPEAQTNAKMFSGMAMKGSGEWLLNFMKGLRTHAAHTISQHITQPKGVRPGD